MVCHLHWIMYGGIGLNSTNKDCSTKS